MGRNRQPGEVSVAERAERASTAAKLRRTMLFPLLAVVFAWLFWYSPEAVSKMQLHPFGGRTMRDHVVEIDSNCLVPYKAKYDLLQQLGAEKALSADAVSARVETLFKLAGTDCGADIDAKVMKMMDVESIEGLDETSELHFLLSKHRRSALQKISGMFSFINIVWTFLIIILVIATLACVGQIILPAIWAAILLIPLGFWEFSAYFISAQITAYAFMFSPSTAPFVALTGGAFLILCFWLSASLHLKNVPQTPRGFPNLLRVFAVYAVLVSVPLTVTFRSSLLALVPVVAFHSFFDISFFLMPGCFAFGMNEKKAPALVMTSIILLAPSAVLRTEPVMQALVEMGNDAVSLVQVVDAFAVPLEWISGISMGLALLVMASRYANWRSDAGTVLVGNVLSIALLLGGMFFGSVLGFMRLQGICGTFFVLYLLTKYCELPFTIKTFWNVGLFGMAGLLYAISLFVRSHPQYFISF